MAAGTGTNDQIRALLLGDDANTLRHLGVNDNGELRTFAHATVTSQRDADTDDSDKIFTVPSNHIWELLYIWCELVTTGTAGNRTMLLDVQDDNDSIMARFTIGVVIGANLTRDWTWISGGYEEQSVIENTIMIPIGGPLILPEGWDVRIYDANAVDANADDLTIALTYLEHGQ